MSGTLGNNKGSTASSSKPGVASNESPNPNNNTANATSENANTVLHHQNNKNEETTQTNNVVQSQASPSPISCENSSVGSSSLTSPDDISTTSSQMCLKPCHRFHTNPAMSSPKHFVHLLNKQGNTSASSSLSAMNHSGGFHYPSHGNSVFSSESTKALKRKQRLAQYKAQTTYSTVDHQTTTSTNASAAGKTDTTTRNNAIDNEKNNNNTTSNSSKSAEGGGESSNNNNASLFNVEISGDPCHVKWAPNLNYIKNIELVAIASPLSPIESHHHHYQQLAGHNNHNHNQMHHHHNSRQQQQQHHHQQQHNLQNNNNHNSLLPNTITQNHGSSVFVLVFDEGIFSHNGDFSLTSELCDLFGLPTESLVAKYDKRNDADNEDRENKGKEKKQKKRFGLRRKVFQSKTLLAIPKTTTAAKVNTSSKQANNEPTNANNTTNTKDNIVDNPNRKSSGLQKLEATYHTVINNLVKPLLSHVSNEVENCAQIFKNEVMGDGRIHSSPIEAFTMSKKKAKLLSDELMTSSSKNGGENENEDGEVSKDQETIDESEGGLITNEKTNRINPKRIEDKDVQIECIEAEVGGTAECPIKPTLVFRINLPYSNTAMEVTNIEWNSDGTSLTIVQRRKGFSSSSGTSSLGTSNTNKKKKANSSNTTNNQNQQQLVSPGNTAVSFWCIPPWLHVDYDDMKVSYDNDDEEFSEEKLIMKANNTCHDCGWEVEDDNDNRSLFPLWEWYLAKYVFKDEFLPREIRRKTKIMMKNIMEQQAYSMELAVASNNNTSVANRHGKKSAARGTRSSNSTTENVNSMMNGDVTCLFWENATPEDERVLGVNAYKERKGHEKDYLHFADDDDDNRDNDDDEIEKKPDYDSIITPSKWIAIGTSKGQIVLHNSAASFLSSHTRKNKNKSSNNSPLLNSISPQGRTVTVPVRHKKRVTCGAWVDNLLVCGYVGTGCLSLVSTFPKTQQSALNNVDRNSPGASRIKQEILEPLFGEKTAKVLGNIMLPGGRDAVHIQIGNIESSKAGSSTTILSVNCESKCLLFYTFPKLIEDPNSNSQPDITSSPAMEVNFSMNALKGGTSCGNIIHHYMIPNTFLAVVAFSSGYFVLFDWVSGTILSDKDVSAVCVDKSNSDTVSPNDDNFLVDVAFHLPTCTAACLTNTGHVIVYHVKITDKGDLIESTAENFISMSSKKHTRPKTKSTSHNDLFINRESPAMSLTGTINLLCARRIVGPRGYHLEFSSDGESVSISLGDESVTILSIKTDAKESTQIKQRLAQRIFLFTPSQIRMLFHILVFVMMWIFKTKLEVSFREFGL